MLRRISEARQLDSYAGGDPERSDPHAGGAFDMDISRIARPATGWNGRKLRRFSQSDLSPGFYGRIRLRFRKQDDLGIPVPKSLLSRSAESSTRRRTVWRCYDLERWATLTQSVLDDEALRAEEADEFQITQLLEEVKSAFDDAKQREGFRDVRSATCCLSWGTRMGRS